jgi:hypothetical protein
MISIKSQIQAALVGDAALITELGGEHISHQYPDDNMPEKFIVHYELENEPLVHADEREVASKITMAIEPYSRGNVTAIALHIDRIITGIGGMRERAPDDDSDVPRNGKAMVYSFTVDSDGTIC